MRQWRTLWPFAVGGVAQKPQGGVGLKPLRTYVALPAHRLLTHQGNQCTDEARELRSNE